MSRIFCSLNVSALLQIELSFFFDPFIIFTHGGRRGHWGGLGGGFGGGGGAPGGW
jgi:hypothetical protein